MIIFNLIKLFIIISKFRLLSDAPKNIKIPLYLKTLSKITSLFFPHTDDDFGHRLRKAFIELGPIYIKFGQTLSTSPSLVGDEIADNLKSLQDKLPSFSSKHVENIIYKNFCYHIEDLFTNFSLEPVSAASIAQVHKATSKDGRIVAVKILRPNIYKQYSSDIKLLYFLAKYLTRYQPKYKRLKLVRVVDIFKETMQYELNLKLEAAAASELADNFVKDSTVYIPRIHWELTTEQVLTLEWIDGISVYDSSMIKEYNLKPTEIAAKIGQMFFNQAFRDGFFHADLHPGNILLRQDGSIALVDFGIMGQIEKKERLILAEILFKFFQRDYNAVAKLHLKAGYIPADSNLLLFAQNCRMIYEPLVGKTFKHVIIADLLNNLFKITEEFGMQTQPQLLLLQKTMIVVEGIGRILTSEVNMWELAQPWITKWAAKNISPEAKILNIFKELFEEGSIL